MDWNFHFSAVDEDPLSSFLNNHESSEGKPDATNDDEARKNKRLARNRESARNSRRRKKQYIEFLEGRVARLTEEVSTLKSMIAATTSTSPDQSFRAKRKALYIRLSEAVNNPDVSEDAIGQMLNELNDKLGVHAMERQEVVSRMFQQTLELMIPLHVKYFLWVSDQDLDFFQEAGTLNEDYASWRELVTTAHFTQEQCAAIREYKGILLQEKDKMSESLQRLKTMRESLEKHSLSFQHYVDDLRSFLNPRQAAGFLLWLEQHNPMPATEQVLNNEDAVTTLFAE